MITVTDYIAGHLIGHEAELTPELMKNAQKTVDATNALKMVYISQGGVLDTPEVASGWRPKGVNAETSNAAATSNHVFCKGLDTRDRLRKFAQWCVLNPKEMERLGLYMEDPRWTPTWVHHQTVAPKSGKRIYIPSTNPPLAAVLEGQKPLPFLLRV